jgi:hypothetical protein
MTNDLSLFKGNTDKCWLRITFQDISVKVFWGTNNLTSLSNEATHLTIERLISTRVLTSYSEVKGLSCVMMNIFNQLMLNVLSLNIDGSCCSTYSIIGEMNINPLAIFITGIDVNEDIT